jgi:HAD superfamily hydrolase (TIGR01549 family)
MSPITHILYDLGNTLLFFDGRWDEVFDRAILASAAALTEAGIEGIDLDRFGLAFAESFQVYYRHREVDLVELTAAHILRETLRDLGAPPPDEAAIGIVLDAFYGVTQAHWKPVDGVHEVLGGLQGRGLHQGILSNASHNADVQTLVDRADLRRYMDFVLTSAEIGIRKPHANAFKQALDRWGITQENVMMVGDTPDADILGAKISGIRSVWVRRYASPQDDTFPRADSDIDDLADLPNLLDEI